MHIEINLLPGPKKRAKAAGAGASLDALKGVVQQVKDPLLVGAVGASAVAVAAIAFIFTTTTARVAGLEGDLESARAEARRFEALLAQKREAQALRDSLVVELNAIRGIDADRYVWPHILDEITRALPDFTWLTNVASLAPSTAAPAAVAPATGAPGASDTVAVDPPLRVQVTGRAADIGGYTQFLRQLSSSPWFTNVVAGQTTTVPEGGDGESGRPVYAFTITVTFSPADSAFIQTVPVRESVR